MISSPARLRKLLRPVRLAGIALSAILVGCGPSGEVREYNRIGLDHYNHARYYEAISMFENARKLDAETPEPSYYIGRCYLALAERKLREDNAFGGMRFCDRAASEFERAYNAFPGYTKAIQGKTEALKLRGRYSAVLDLAAWASNNSGPRAKMLILESRELAQSGDLDRCLRKLKEAIAVEPENAATHAELGRFYLRCGQDREAIEALQKAYRLDPGAPGVVTALAQLNALPDKSSSTSYDPAGSLRRNEPADEPPADDHSGSAGRVAPVEPLPDESAPHGDSEHDGRAESDESPR